MRVAAQRLVDQLSLSAEAASARSMLDAAEIATEMKTSCDTPLPPTLDTVPATTLREGVTNILRHSKVQHCSISASATDGVVRLELANDGVGGEPADVFAQKGSGLSNLTDRLAAFGGSLTAEVSQDGWFRLVAEVPVEGPRPEARVVQAVGMSGGVDHGRDQDPAG